MTNDNNGDPHEKIIDDVISDVISDVILYALNVLAEVPLTGDNKLDEILILCRTYKNDPNKGDKDV
jgi:hypothetical protein